MRYSRAADMGVAMGKEGTDVVLVKLEMILADGDDHCHRRS
jgi:magnesium-transporting ATPase (P-type)